MSLIELSLSIIMYGFFLIDLSFIESNLNNLTIFRVKFRTSEKKFDRV